MTRLDRHVRQVQGKLMLTILFKALAWSLMLFLAAVWMAVLIGKLFQVHLPRQMIWFWCGLGSALVIAAIYAFVRRPSPRQAAVAIDDRLALQEKFSTALFVRPMKDPFAQAAVRDAERTADSVNLQRQFPVKYPRAFVGTAAMAVAIFLTAWLVKPMDLFGQEEKRQKQAQVQVEKAQVKKEIEKAIARIDSAPKSASNGQEIQNARQELVKLANLKDINDPASARRTAQRAVEDVKAMEKKVQDLQAFAAAQQKNREWEKLASTPIDDTGPVGQAQAAMSKGNVTEAMANLDKAVANFDKMAKQDQQKSADQMDKFAAQIQKMAEDPNVKKQIEQELQKQGASQQQAKDIAQKMQQAANGDQKAMQQLQQMQNQMMQQMNNGQGPTAQQMAQMKGLMQQMQAKANTQAQAQQMSQAAQQMAQAMKQQAAQAQGQKGQGQPQQQGNQQSQSAQGKQGQGQNQSQSGGQGAGGGSQSANAQQQMKQQMQQMQAAAADAQAVAARQQGGGDQGEGGGADDALNQAAADNFQPGDQGNAAGELGDPNRAGGNGGGGGPGRGMGARAKPQQAPFTVKQEISKSQTIEGGKILASTFVKADTLKGDSKVGLSRAVAAAENDVTDEIDEERVSKQAQSTVKEYFQTLKDDSTK